MGSGVCIEDRKNLGDYIREIDPNKYYEERVFDSEYCKSYSDMATHCKYKHDCLSCEYNGTSCMGLFFLKDRMAKDYAKMAEILRSIERADDWDRPCPDYLADR